MRQVLAFAVIALALTACAAAPTYDTRINRTYALGKVQETPVGAAMLMRENITFVETKEWVGLLFSPDGWKHTVAATESSFREEFIYSGRSENTITISYREYRRDFARPAFFQELRYDLSQANVIVFRNYRIEVIRAGNDSIQFKVLSDR